MLALYVLSLIDISHIYHHVYVYVCVVFLKYVLTREKLVSLSSPIFGHFTIDEIPESGLTNLRTSLLFTSKVVV